VTAVRSEPTRRLPRAQRREQVLDAAAPTFARAGFANTGLDVIAAEAGVTKVSLYRFFASKADLYREVLHRAGHRVREAVGADDFDEASIPALTRAAAADPDGFRLLFRYAAREPPRRGPDAPVHLDRDRRPPPGSHQRRPMAQLGGATAAHRHH
jgi:AcrR family transcriptional regulator